MNYNRQVGVTRDRRARDALWRPPGSTFGRRRCRDAAHEGDDRALFAVLEVRIEPVRLVDGIELVLGARHPGDVFGEVPIGSGPSGISCPALCGG
jgi:hypothetical protein